MQKMEFAVLNKFGDEEKYFKKFELLQKNQDNSTITKSFIDLVIVSKEFTN